MSKKHKLDGTLYVSICPRCYSSNIQQLARQFKGICQGEHQPPAILNKSTYMPDAALSSLFITPHGCTIQV